MVASIFYGADTRTRKLTPFAFVRASEMKITPQKFTTEPAQNPRDILRHSFGSAPRRRGFGGKVLSTGPVVDIMLDFDSNVVQRVKESVWHSRQALQEL